jgi:hypothetical protein
VIASRVRPLLAAVAIVVATAPARPATGDDRDVATAEALFEAARQAVAQGNYASACPKFAESARLDPAAGAWLNLADCEERLGHLAAAWSAWHEGVALLPRDDERLAPARQRAQAIDKRLPRLVVKLSPDSRRGARLRRDDVDLGTASFDIPLPLDPGRHSIQVEAPGFAPSSSEITLAEGETRTIEIALSAIVPSTAPAPTVIATSTPNAAESKSDTASRDADGPSRRRMLWTGGWILGGVGIAGLGLGVTTGVMAIAKKGTVQAHCHAGGCDPSGFDAAQAGHTLATTSNVALAAGGVLVAAGLWLVLTNAPRAETKLTIAPARAGAGATFAFERTF